MLGLAQAGVGNLIVQEDKNENYIFPKAYILMEYAPGKKLTDMLYHPETRARLKDFKVTDAFDIAEQLGQRLEQLHSDPCNLVLRDLHINNLIYDKATGKLSVVDFGDALEMKQGAATGTAMGSEPYMAPEVLKALGEQTRQLLETGKVVDVQAEYTEKSSVYSYGAILANMLGLGSQKKSSYQKSESEVFIEMYLFDGSHRTDAKNLSNVCIIKDEGLRQDMLALLKGMLSHDPADRPALKTVNETLGNIMLDHAKEFKQASSSTAMLMQVMPRDTTMPAARAAIAPPTVTPVTADKAAAEAEQAAKITKEKEVEPVKVQDYRPTGLSR